MFNVSEDTAVAFFLGILFTVGCIVLVQAYYAIRDRHPALRKQRQDPIDYIEPTLQKGPSHVVHHDPVAL